MQGDVVAMIVKSPAVAICGILSVIADGVNLILV